MAGHKKIKNAIKNLIFATFYLIKSEIGYIKNEVLCVPGLSVGGSSVGGLPVWGLPV